MLLPEARSADILEQEADSELMVYDLRADKAYILNETSKIVYKACGKQTFDELKRKYKFTDDLIHLALAELQKSGLLVDHQSDHFKGLSRREVVKRVGLACVTVLPLVAGITAPTSSNAASSTCPQNTIACQTDAICSTVLTPTCPCPNFCECLNNCCTLVRSGACNMP